MKHVDLISLRCMGSGGKDFIEGHHTKLISELSDGDKTRVEDIAMLCSNCHRMVHRKPILSVEKSQENFKQMKDRKEKI